MGWGGAPRTPQKPFGVQWGGEGGVRGCGDGCKGKGGAVLQAVHEVSRARSSARITAPTHHPGPAGSPRRARGSASSCTLHPLLLLRGEGGGI